MRFSLPSIKLSELCWTIWFVYHALDSSQKVEGVAELTWLIVAKKAFVGWTLNFRVRISLKGTVISRESIHPEEGGRFPFTKNFGKFLLGISVWEECVSFFTSPIRSQALRCRSTKRPLALVNCSAVFSSASLFVAFPPNKCLLSAYVIIRSLTSAFSYLSLGLKW